MSYVIVGLGNPGEEYSDTRHNTGRIALDIFRKKIDFPEWKADKMHKAEMSKGKLGKESLVLLAPDTFMNKSGAAVAPFIKNAKQAERLVVIHDELDLPVGMMKISFNRG